MPTAPESRKRLRESDTTSLSMLETLDDQKSKFLEWMLGVPAKTFFEEYFEKRYLFTHREKEDGSYYTRGDPEFGIPIDWTTNYMRHVVSSKKLQFRTDANFVRVVPETKRRVAYKTAGAVTLPELNKCFQDGWSVHFIRPHEHSKNCAAIVSLLEDIFQSQCGVNSYWTPKHTQGFAAHYDDVDVFLLQLEGSKRWRLYDPLEPVDRLARHSSEDYLPEELGVPTIDLVLTAGDMLYLPRGTIHVGDTVDLAEDSLHVTFSANQMHTWADLFLEATRYMVESRAANDIKWRHAIPRGWMHVMGEANAPAYRKQTPRAAPLTVTEQKIRSGIAATYQYLASDLSRGLGTEHIMDVCMDQYAIRVLEKMQPVSSHLMLKHAVREGQTQREHGTSRKTPSGTTEVPELSLKTRVRLLNPQAVRLVLSVPGEAHVYHTADNSFVTFEKPLGKLRYEADFAPAVTALLTMYPKGIEIGRMPMPAFEKSPDDLQENQLLLAETLFSAGVLEVLHKS